MFVSLSGIKQCRFLAYSFHAYIIHLVSNQIFHDYNQMAHLLAQPSDSFPLEKMFIDNRLVGQFIKFVQTDDDQIISDAKHIINRPECRRFNRCRPI